MNKIRDGDVYKTITVQGVTFELKYGYYEEYEKSHSEPVPIYPDFRREPRHTEDGHPFVTAMQDTCEGFRGEDCSLGCYACRHFKEGEDLIGICLSADRRLRRRDGVININEGKSQTSLSK